MTISGIGELPLFKRRSNSSSIEELEALLDLLPHPTLIAEARSGRVLFANAPVTQISAYTRRELAELELPTLLPELTAADLQPADGARPRPQKLVTRSSRETQVSVKVDSLGGPDHWVAISLLPPQKSEQDPQAVQQQRWEALHMLSLAQQQGDLAGCLRQTLQAGALLTGAAGLALYLPGEEGNLQLHSASGSPAGFPVALAAGDLGHLRIPKIWQPGRPLDSALHKAAHAAKLAYLASTPLDLSNPESGLLACTSEGDPQAPPGEELLAQLQIVAASAATALLGYQAQQELRGQLDRFAQSEAVSSLLQAQTQDGILFADGELRVLEINPAAENMLGYATAEVRGRPANDVLVSSQSLTPAMELALAEGKAIELGERKLHRRDGSEFLAALRVAAIPGGEGQAAALAVLFSDLSAHEAFHLESQQLQQRAFLGEMTAYFAHEVGNPINNISTGLQRMRRGLPAEDPMQELLRRMEEDCDRLDHRMKSILNLSRNMEHRPAPLDIGEFCRLQLERWRPRMARKNIKEFLQVAEGTPPVMGDSRALDQVFTNLITNAIHALEGQEDGMLAIKVGPHAEDSNQVEIQLSDNGPGIAKELQERVFEPFFTTKRTEGTGLGLAITRRILLMHKGEILLESVPGGTLFKIRLPVAPRNAYEGMLPE
ncbi:MAG: PAS domain-containing protein [Anaerolineales bacterium]|nr:PAS domain-containing protein [Anaerolineales bacterium]